MGRGTEIPTSYALVCLATFTDESNAIVMGNTDQAEGRFRQDDEVDGSDPADPAAGLE